MSSIASNPLLQAALSYAEKGWAVFPLAPGTKVPTAGSAGHKDATTDADTIRRLWTATPAANIGIATGTPSGVWVLDIDGPQGVADLDKLETQHGTLPPTRVVATPSGGGHFLWRMPAGIDIRNRQDVDGWEIDVRGTGGYAVAPPSRTVDGPKTVAGVYAVATDHVIADAPQWVLDMVTRRETPAPTPPATPIPTATPGTDAYTRAVAYVAKMPAAISGQRGHDATFTAARACYTGFALSVEETYRLLRDHYNPRCVPPWSESELRHKAQSAADTPSDHPCGHLLAPRDDRRAAVAATGGAGVPAAEQTAGSEPARPRFEWMDSEQFDDGDFRPCFLIDRVLVAAQPAVLAAPVKSLKTSVGIDLCISLATGTPALGQFAVPVPVKAAIASMESGKSALQGTARAVCKQRGINLRDVGANLLWTFNVPTLSDKPAVADFVCGLIDRGVKVVLLDPLYLCLGDVDAKNMMEVGKVLRSVSEMMTPAGLLPLIVHHANRGLTFGEPMGLENLAYSGCDAFARQWLLLSRREKYKSDGVHKLWMTIGGSENQNGLFAANVDTGTIDTGRRWDVAVMDAASLQQNAAVERETKAMEKTSKQVADDKAKVLKAIDSEKSKGLEAATATAIKNHANLSSKRVNDAIDRLIDEGTIQPHEFRKGIGSNAKRPVTGYRRPVVVEQTDINFDHPVKDEIPDGNPGCPDGSPVTGNTNREPSGTVPPCKGGLSGSPDGGDPETAPSPKTTGRRRKKATVPDGAVPA